MSKILAARRHARKLQQASTKKWNALSLAERKKIARAVLANKEKGIDAMTKAVEDELNDTPK